MRGEVTCPESIIIRQQRSSGDRTESQSALFTALPSHLLRGSERAPEGSVPRLMTLTHVPAAAWPCGRQQPTGVTGVIYCAFICALQCRVGFTKMAVTPTPELPICSLTDVALGPLAFTLVGFKLAGGTFNRCEWGQWPVPLSKACLRHGSLIGPEREQEGLQTLGNNHSGHPIGAHKVLTRI